ncbi:hypothetical protein P4123_00950 [Pseudomonas aeruginosa]|nr:hypothetical protein [Pseudomonas aeruginosa]
MKEQLRGVPDKGVGYGSLRYLAGEEAAARLAALPQPRITFNYLGRFDRQFDGRRCWYRPRKAPAPPRIRAPRWPTG